MDKHYEELYDFTVKKYKDFEEDNQFGFFMFLTLCKSEDNFFLNYIVQVGRRIKCTDYYNIHSFKSYVCELIYNGIRLFPEICEYKISFRNKKNLI